MKTTIVFLLLLFSFNAFAADAGGHGGVAGNATQTSVTVGIASVTILAANTNRVGCFISAVETTSDIFVSFMGAAVIGAGSLRIYAGSSRSCADIWGAAIPTGAISAISGVAGQSVGIGETTR